MIQAVVERLSCDTVIVGDAQSRHAGLRISAALGQQVFDAEPGVLRYEQDGGRAWILSWRRLVFAELPIPRAVLLGEALQQHGYPAREIPELGFEPRHELLRLLGCAFTVRPERGGWVVVATDDLKTTLPKVEISGPEVFGTPIPAAAWPFLEGLEAICPCEGVTFTDLRRVASQFGVGVRAAKVHTRAGAGTGCQGAFCRTPIQTWMEHHHGHRPELIPPPAARAPLVPVPIRTWLDCASGGSS